jgi:hypothetical protein
MHSLETEKIEYSIFQKSCSAHQNFLPSFPSFTMASPNFLISYFNTVTWAEFNLNPHKLHHSKRIRACREGTIVVLINKDLPAIVGVAELGGAMQEHHLLDEDTYSGDNAKYNKYEVAIKHLHILRNPLHLSDVKMLCGIPPTYTMKDNLTKVQVISWVQPFIKPCEKTLHENEIPFVMHRYTTLIRSLL